VPENFQTVSERVFSEVRVDGVLRSSLSLRGFGLAFEDAPRGYEILGIGNGRKGSGADGSDPLRR
jgi:hypothetical protein